MNPIIPISVPFTNITNPTLLQLLGLASLVLGGMTLAAGLVMFTLAHLSPSLRARISQEFAIRALIASCFFTFAAGISFFIMSHLAGAVLALAAGLMAMVMGWSPFRYVRQQQAVPGAESATPATEEAATETAAEVKAATGGEPETDAPNATSDDEPEIDLAEIFDSGAEEPFDFEGTYGPPPPLSTPST